MHSKFPWTLHSHTPTAIAAIPALIQALEDIVNPLGALKRYAAEQGRQLEGIAAMQLCKDPEHLRSIARTALARITTGEPAEAETQRAVVIKALGIARKSILTGFGTVEAVAAIDAVLALIGRVK